jgi:hypothetical protein
MTTTPLVVDGVTEINQTIQNSTAAHGVQDYASTALRTSFGHATYEGQVTAITASDRLEIYDGAAWQRGPHWASGGRTCARLRRAANQSVATATTTDISWDTEDQDTDGFITAPGTTLTVPANLGGLYLANAIVSYPSDPGSSTALWIVWTIGGVQWITTTEEGSANRATDGGGRYFVGATGTEYLSAGDTVKVSVRQSSGGSLNATGRFHLTRLAV